MTYTLFALYTDIVTHYGSKTSKVYCIVTILVSCNIHTCDGLSSQTVYATFTGRSMGSKGL